MKCYNCGSELTWGGDHDCEDDEEHETVTNLSCPNCNAFILVYWGEKNTEKKTLNEGDFYDDFNYVYYC